MLERTPELRDFINNRNNRNKGLAKLSAQYNKTCGCKLSGPGALLGFNDDNASKTS